MPDDSPLPALADQIYSKFLTELEAAGGDDRLLAGALRSCVAGGVIGDRSNIINAVRAALSERAADEA